MASLQTYLNDHLAGATAALQLLQHLIDHAQDADEADFLREFRTTGDPPVRLFTPDAEFAAFCRGLREEVQADAEELRALMKRLGLAESAVKKAGAWLAEKVTEIMLLLEGEGASELGRFQALEALCLGITGKKALWTALQTVQDASAAWASASKALANSLPSLQGAQESAALWAGVDLPRLIRRAEDQYQRTEAVRRATAPRVLR